MRHLPLFFLVPIILGCGAASSAPPPSAPSVLVDISAARPVAPIEQEAARATRQPAATRPPAVTAAPAIARVGEMGDVAQKFGMWATVTQVDTLRTVGNQLVTVAAGQKLVIVYVIVGNDADTPMPVNTLNATLFDSEGFASKAKLDGAGRRIDSITLGRGERVQGEMAFEVPTASRPVLFRLTTNVIGGAIFEMGLSIPASPLKLNPLIRTRPVYARAGTTVDVGGYTLSVVGFELTPKASGIYKAQPGYKLVAVEVIVGNNKGDKMSVNPQNAHLVDTRGFVWRVPMGGRDGKQLDSQEIGKGERVRGWISFEIPSDATPEAVRMDYGNMFSPTTVYGAVR